MKQRFDRIRGSFWFLPAVLCVVSLAFAQTVIVVDQYIDDSGSDFWNGLLSGVGISGSRDILAAISGSMLAVAATAFSITIAVLATASSTYGPRLVRNFMADRGNQLVLGIFCATFLYGLVVLRSIRSVDEQEFVPELAVNIAVLLAVADVAVLVYFINHIAASIQVATLATRVRQELIQSVDDSFPCERPADAVDAATPEGRGAPIDAGTTGFVLSIDGKRLVEVAASHELVVEIVANVSSHVVSSEPILTVWGTRPAEGKTAEQLRSCFVIAGQRTPEQDPRFSVQQLTEMAVRALSPAMNDPYTAQNAINELAGGLVPMVTRPTPTTMLGDSGGALRVILKPVPMCELLNDVFDAVRHYAIDHVMVLVTAFALIERLGDATIHDDVRQTLLRHLDLIMEAYRATDAQQADLHRLTTLAQRVGAAVA